MVAAIGVAAVLLIVVMGVAALVGQTNKSLKVYANRGAAWNAVDMYLPGVLADYRAKGATSLMLNFESKDITCAFMVNAANPDDAALARLGIPVVPGEVIVTASATPTGGAAMNVTLLASPAADSARPYIVLDVTQEKAAAK